MFKEIERELLSIISDDPIERIAHMPTKEIAKTMHLLYGIKFEDIHRTYTEKLDSYNRLVVIYKGGDFVVQDLCPIEGKMYHITLFPEHLLNKDETNAVTLSRAIIKYISIRVALLLNNYERISSKIKDNLFDLVCFQSIPVLTCAVMRKIYSGPTLSTVIHMSLTELIKLYKNTYSEQGIDTILNLFDEGLGVNELLDNGFICSIEVDDTRYPGIWVSKKSEKEEEQ